MSKSDKLRRTGRELVLYEYEFKPLIVSKEEQDRIDLMEEWRRVINYATIATMLGRLR